MYITQNRYCPIPHSPVKNDLVSLAHILSDSTNCPYEQIAFSYTKENGTTGKCRGYEFTRNFVDEPYRSAYISAFWSDGRGKIEITVMPGVGCTVNLSANHLTEAETVDLINQICEKVSDILSPTEPPEQDKNNTINQTPTPKARRRTFPNLLRSALRIVGSKFLELIVNDTWPFIVSFFKRLFFLVF